MRSSCIIYLQIYSLGNVTNLLCLLNDRHSWKFQTCIKAIPLPILVCPYGIFSSALSGLVLNLSDEAFIAFLQRLFHHLIDFVLRKCSLCADLYCYYGHALYTTLAFPLSPSSSLPSLLYLYLFQGTLFIVEKAVFPEMILIVYMSLRE